MTLSKLERELLTIALEERSGHGIAAIYNTRKVGYVRNIGYDRLFRTMAKLVKEGLVSKRDEKLTRFFTTTKAGRDAVNP